MKKLSKLIPCPIYFTFLNLNGKECLEAVTMLFANKDENHKINHFIPNLGPE